MLEYEGKTCTILYNENLIGEIIIKSNLSMYSNDINRALGRGEIQVNPTDILEFVAERYIKPKLIQCIENTPALDILLNQINPEE